MHFGCHTEGKTAEDCTDEHHQRHALEQFALVVANQCDEEDQLYEDAEGFAKILQGQFLSNTPAGGDGICDEL